MTDKHIPASKLLALIDSATDAINLSFASELLVIKADDLRALIDAEPKKIPLCNLWVNPDNLNYEVDHCEHPLDELIPVYAAPPADNLIAELQATIDRLTEQRDRLLKACSEELKRGKLTSLPLKLEFAESKGFSGQDSLKKVHEWMQDTHVNFVETYIALIAEIEGHSKYARDE